jgi:carbon monoxide dehydrogenase subunit G
MNVTVERGIQGPKEKVWRAITDLENSPKVISGIRKINVLEKPAKGVVGLKWEETREMFGKEATETMWITEAKEKEYYCTRAESHGSIYTTRLALGERDGNTTLVMSFSGEPQTTLAKIMSYLMAPLIRSSLKKTMAQDLEDIRRYVEGR